MNIHVIGTSRSGKTPVATQIAAGLGCPVISASEWFRKVFPDQGFADRQVFTDAITRFTLQVMRRDPDHNLRYLRSRHDLSQTCVIEGFRNPHDFVNLFDYRTDRVLFLSCGETDLRPTDFEGGIGVIGAYLEYLIACKLMKPGQVVSYRMETFAGIETVAAGYLASLPPEVRLQPQEGVAARIHAEIDPIPVAVRQEFLYDMDPAKKGPLVPGRIFGVSSYPGHLPTFQVLLEDGSVFSYLPAHAVVDLTLYEPGLEYGAEALTYHACPAGEFRVNVYKILAGPVQAYFKNRTGGTGHWAGGRYVMTLDWFEGNDLLHLIALESGQFAFLPQHKIKFGSGAAQTFEPYRKLHAEWRGDSSGLRQEELLRLGAELGALLLYTRCHDMGEFGGSADACNLRELLLEGLGHHDPDPQVPLAEIVRHVKQQLGSGKAGSL